jgi:16S rRNA (uracil1498-N3)-methyltransferase
MKRLLCPELPKPGRAVILPETEATHAVRVLRLRDGDHVEAIDGKGGSAKVVLRVRGDVVKAEYVQGAQRPGATAGDNQVVPIALEMAVLKGDAMEWVIEKSVELGVRRLIPVLTKHAVVQMKNKGPEAFQQRWQKIADQALKQCGRLKSMRVEKPVELEELLASDTQGPRLWCDEKLSGSASPDLIQSLQDVDRFADEIRLLIGPEGGWSDQERELLSRSPNTRPINLGPLVLRAETAALFGVSLIAATLRSKSEKSS